MEVAALPHQVFRPIQPAMATLAPEHPQQILAVQRTPPQVRFLATDRVAQLHQVFRQIRQTTATLAEAANASMLA